MPVAELAQHPLLLPVQAQRLREVSLRHPDVLRPGVQAPGQPVPVAEPPAQPLALLDQPWCHRQLFLALEEATTFEGSAALRRALLRSSAPDGRSAVERWARLHVMEVAEGRRYTWEEVLEANTDASFAEEAEQMPPWVERLRRRVDPDFDLPAPEPKRPPVGPPAPEESPAEGPFRARRPDEPRRRDS